MVILEQQPCSTANFDDFKKYNITIEEEE